MNTSLPYRVMMTRPNRGVFEYCASLADAKRLAKWGNEGLPPRRIQARNANGKWVTVKVDWALGRAPWPNVKRLASQLSEHQP